MAMPVYALARAFCNFLESEGILDKFLNRFSLSILNTPEDRDDLRDFIVCRYFYVRADMTFQEFAKSLVSIAFKWRLTPEGESFWRDVSTRWVAHLRSLK